MEAVKTLLGRPSWAFPILTGILLAPTLRANGAVLASPGYDRSSGLFLDFQGASFPEIPDSPTKEEAREALDVLCDLLAQSPFVSPADRSVALSYLLTILVRPTLPTSPLFAFSATTRGTGKSWIIACLSG